VPAVNPLLLPPRLALRALTDLQSNARATGRLAGRLDGLEQRADRVEATMLEGIAVAVAIEQRAGQALVLAERAVERFDALLAAAERIDQRAVAVLELGARVDARGAEVAEEGRRLREAAAEVALRGAEVAEALPLLERAVTMAEPLEGAVERFGRIVDRLPRAPVPRRGRPMPPPD
jgi:hypothetical protein